MRGWRDVALLATFRAMTIALSLAAIAAAWVLLLLDVEPVPTWFFVFAWYPTLLLLDALVSRGGREVPLHRSGWRGVSLLVWSPVVWLLFEALNFRLRNWYYVFVPDHDVERWAGMTLSFATVLPALFLSGRLLERWGVGTRWRVGPITLRPWHLSAARFVGLLMLVLALVMPRFFFPLVWGAVWLMVEPTVYRRRPEWSLLHDIERGEWSRIGRLLLAGLCVGLLWEFLNFWARGKWIYTVPWMENLRLFEMPPLGFLGFPFFALEAWALYHLLAALGIAVPFDGSRRASGRRLVVALPVALAFAATALQGIDSWSVGSTTPRIERMPDVRRTDERLLKAAGYGSVFLLASTAPDSLAQRTGLAPQRAAAVVEVSRLATLRSLGTRNARLLRIAGARSVCAVSRREPHALWLAVHAVIQEWTPGKVLRSPTTVIPPSPRPTEAEVGVWVRGARRACAPD
jgi:hypothetical protein